MRKFGGGYIRGEREGRFFRGGVIFIGFEDLKRKVRGWREFFRKIRKGRRLLGKLR